MPKSYSIVGMEHQHAVEFIGSLEPGVAAVLIREPTNKFDANAVAVWISGRRVGYVPKAQNKVLAPFIDQNGQMSSIGGIIAMDGKVIEGNFGNSIAAKFIRSPNSGYPMIQVD